jgi:hypothetical protein
LVEIGGYDIRYKSISAIDYSHVNIQGNETTKYLFTGSANGLTFEIAVYDTAGIYSDYIPIN